MKSCTLDSSFRILCLISSLYFLNSPGFNGLFFRDMKINMFPSFTVTAIFPLICCLMYSSLFITSEDKSRPALSAFVVYTLNASSNSVFPCLSLRILRMSACIKFTPRYLPLIKQSEKSFCREIQRRHIPCFLKERNISSSRIKNRMQSLPALLYIHKVCLCRATLRHQAPQIKTNSYIPFCQ